MKNKVLNQLGKEMILASLMGARERLLADPDYKTPKQIIEECKKEEEYKEERHW